ncbi:MAG: hypothetical protein ACOX38_06835, partial [Bacillota bacterium]
WAFRLIKHETAHDHSRASGQIRRSLYKLKGAPEAGLFHARRAALLAPDESEYKERVLEYYRPGFRTGVLASGSYPAGSGSVGVQPRQPRGAGPSGALGARRILTRVPNRVDPNRDRAKAEAVGPPIVNCECDANGCQVRVC